MSEQEEVAVGSRDAPGRYGMKKGLWMQVRGPESKSWIYRYKWNGRSREMGLGTTAMVTQEEARKLVDFWRAVLGEGRDPLAVRQEEFQKDGLRIGRRMSFEAVAEQCIAERAEFKNWRGERTSKSWKASLRKHAYQQLKNLPISEITMDDLLTKVLLPIWRKTPVQSEKVRDRARVVFDFAIGRGWRTSTNPAVWKAQLEKKLPLLDRDENFYPAVHWSQAKEFYTHVKSMKGIAARALEFLLLTCVRSQSVRFATWGEIDFFDQSWSIPNEHTKSGKPFRTPLSPAAIELLKSLDPDAHKKSDLIFPSPRGGMILSDAAISAVMKSMQYGSERRLRLEERTVTAKYPDRESGRAGVPHGLRSMFRDYVGENFPFPDAIVEYHLDHVVGTVVERRYKRERAFRIRRKMAELWAEALRNGPGDFDADSYLRYAALGDLLGTLRSSENATSRHTACQNKEADGAFRFEGEETRQLGTAISKVGWQASNLCAEDEIRVPKAFLESLLKAVAKASQQA